MKRLLCALLIVFVATTATAEIWRDDFVPTIVGSGEYDPETGLEIMNRTLPDWSSNGDGFVSTLDTVTGEDTADLGWWWFDAMYRDIGVIYEANTIYQLTVQVRDGGDGAGGSAADINNCCGDIEIGFNRTDTWAKVTDFVNNPAAYAYQPNFSLPNDGIFGEGTGWHTYSVTINTADFAPDLIGAPMGVEMFAVNGNAVAAWTTFNNVSVSIIPEPATMALLGLGGLALRRRKS